jgi:oligopeptide/dipeptide ABC transporter ATP-binding protein
LLLSISDLTVHYRSGAEFVKAVDHVNLEVGSNEVVAIVGESGSGKSTMAFSIPNLLPRSALVRSGRVLFKGEDLLKAPAERLRRIRGREIGMIFQDPMSYLDPLMRVGEQVAEVVMIHENLGKEGARAKATKILEEARVPDLERVYDYYPNQLSGGMAQRIMIGAAIVQGPSLLIADEPTSNLDITVQAQILNLLKSLKKRRGTSIVLITHDMGIVSGIADRVVIAYAGKIMEEGTTRQVFSEPRHPYTRALIESSSAGRKRSGGVVEIAGSLPDLTRPPPGCRFAPRCPLAFEKCVHDPPEIVSPDRSRVLCWLYEN